MIHWKKLTNPDYIGAYVLEDGKDMVLTIKTIVREIVTGEAGKKEECTVAHFNEPVKPMILNKTNCKTIEKIYKTPYIEEWTGKRIQIFVDHNVKIKGETVDALRIRAIIPEVIGSTCEECKKQVTEHNGASPSVIIKATKNKYGVVLCGECALKRKASESVEVVKDASVQ